MALDQESEIFQQFYTYLQQKNPAGFLIPPANEEQILVAEELFEISFPPLLKAIYTRIANGGFSPEGSPASYIVGIPGNFQYESMEQLRQERNSSLERISSFVDIEVLEERAGPPFIVNLPPYMDPRHMFRLYEDSYYIFYIHCKTSRIYLATDDYSGAIEYSGKRMKGLTWFRIRNSVADWLSSWMQGESWGDWIDEAGELLLGKTFMRTGEFWEDEPLYLSSTRSQ